MALRLHRSRSQKVERQVSKSIITNYLRYLALQNFHRMGSLSTLTTVAGRFTTQAQFDTYSVFLNSIDAAIGEPLKSGMTSAREMLEWDANYMQEFIGHLNHLKGSAATKVMSIFVLLISLVVIYIFN